jgi:hypothetical protein
VLHADDSNHHIGAARHFADTSTCMPVTAVLSYVDAPKDWRLAAMPRPRLPGESPVAHAEPGPRRSQSATVAA